MVPEVWIADKAFPFRNDLLWTGLGENDFLWAKHVNKWLFVQSKHCINDALTKWLVVQSFIPCSMNSRNTFERKLFVYSCCFQAGFEKMVYTDSTIFDATLIQIFKSVVNKLK